MDQVTCRAYSDDYNVDITFDGAEYFRQITPTQMEELLTACGYKMYGDFSTDAIVEYYEETKTKRLFDYLGFGITDSNGDQIGFGGEITYPMELYLFLQKHNPAAFEAFQDYRRENGELPPNQ